MKLLTLADHLVRMALQKDLLKAVISRILWAYDSPNKVSSNVGLCSLSSGNCSEATTFPMIKYSIVW